MINELKDMIRETLHVAEPVDVNIDSFGEAALQLVLLYHLPEPMAEGGKVAEVKQEINMRTYEILMRYTGSAEVQAEVKTQPKGETEPGDSSQNDADTEA